MFMRGVSDKETPRFFFAFRPCTVGMRVSVAGGGGGVSRVSLSDWLALQARIRGFETPRLLRDRPTDGAASVSENLGGVLRAQDENYVDHILLPT